MFCSDRRYVTRPISISINPTHATSEVNAESADRRRSYYLKLAETARSKGAGHLSSTASEYVSDNTCERL